MMTPSPLNLIPMVPEYRQYRLRCRFIIGADWCHRVIEPMCRHLEQSAYEAGCRFLEAMEHQGWQSSNGRLKITGGPWPATPIGTSTLVLPSRPVRGHGPHPRSGDAYESPVVEIPTVETSDDWEYELSGLFVRPMMPTVMSVAAAAALERKRRVR